MLKDAVIANRSYAIWKMEAGETLDKIAAEVIRQDCPDFLVPFKAISIDESLELRYELADGVRLSYRPQRMYKREFIQQLIAMLLPFKNCSDWFLNYRCFCLDPQYIFVSAKDMTIRYLYIPVTEYEQTDEEIMNFFSRFVVNMDLLDDKNFTLQLLRILQGGHSSLLQLLEYLQKEEESGMRTGQAREALYGAAGVQDAFKMPGQQPLGEIGAGQQRLAESGSGQQQFAKAGSAQQQFAEVGGGAQRFAEAGGGQNQFGAAPLSGISKESPEKSSAKNAGRGEALEQQAPFASREFGKSNLEGALFESLYQDMGTDKKKEKKKKEKPPKEKPVKEKPAKDSAAKGLFGGLLGGKKEKKPEAEAAGKEAAPIPERQMQQEHYRPVQDYAFGESVRPQNRYVGEDETEIIDGFYEEKDLSVLRLKLEHSGNHAAPQMIELHLENGHATVGRYDKYGSPCADFNFDHSLTFVSRNHFRIELRGDSYLIIDLNSGNGTMLNDQELVPNVAYELHVGDFIVLSKKTRLTYRVV